MWGPRRNPRATGRRLTNADHLMPARVAAARYGCAQQRSVCRVAMQQRLESGRQYRKQRGPPRLCRSLKRAVRFGSMVHSQLEPRGVRTGGPERSPGRSSITAPRQLPLPEGPQRFAVGSLQPLVLCLTKSPYDASIRESRRPAIALSRIERLQVAEHRQATRNRNTVMNGQKEDVLGGRSLIQARAHQRSAPSPSERLRSAARA
jgi:hypothetical protein